jgi:uncharacterized sulfatase
MTMALDRRCTRRTALLWFLALALLPAGHSLRAAEDAPQPNILWITCEDMSPNLGCYGDPDAITPNIDRLASRGIRYTHAFSTSGVCAPSRSCLITGVYPSSLGTQYMRCDGELPDFVRCFPQYLREAGYYCTNNSKTDYNFKMPKGSWDESSGKAHWRNRKPGQPFFAVFNNTDTHESKIRSRGNAFARLTSRLTADQRRSPEKITLPGYHPDTPEARRDWANDHELITAMDLESGDILKQLEEDGLADNTIVFFFSDHGVGLARGKRWLYDSGMHVPLIVHFPKKFAHLAPQPMGTTTDRLVSFVDFAPTVLSLAGVKIPEHMMGVAFLGKSAGQPRQYVYGLRDRMDERYDIIRAVRDQRYKYLRNYRPDLPYSQYLDYAEQGPTMQSIRRLKSEGKLPAALELFMSDVKPPEELYDTQSDPYELKNLAGSAEHQEVLKRLRAAHLKWMDDTLDVGLVPEPNLRERTRGSSPYEVARQGESVLPLKRIRQAAITAQGGEAAQGKMRQLLADNDPAVRYWGCIGLGAQHQVDNSSVAALEAALQDSSSTVRMAAADGLVRLGRSEKALPVLAAGLQDDNPWIRLAAMHGLDRLGKQAAPVADQIKAVLKDTNQYVGRVADHALEALGDAGQ